MGFLDCVRVVGLGLVAYCGLNVLVVILIVGDLVLDSVWWLLGALGLGGFFW